MEVCRAPDLLELPNGGTQVSDATKMALDDAIRAHIADECDGKTLMSWVMVTYAVQMEDFGTGAGGYYREVANGQALHITDGLLRCGQRLTDDIWNDEGVPE